MSTETVSAQLSQVLERFDIDQEMFSGLAGALVWRIGRLSDEAPVTVRVGTAAGLERFAELPRLRNASDQELEEALRDGSLHVEWVGPRP